MFFLPFPQRTVSRSSKLNFERSKSLWGASQLPSAWPECTIQVAFFCPVTTDEALPKVPCFQCTQHSTHDSANTHIEGYFFCPIHSNDCVQAEGRDREGIAHGSTSSPGGDDFLPLQVVGLVCFTSPPAHFFVTHCVTGHMSIITVA